MDSLAVSPGLSRQGEAPPTPEREEPATSGKADGLNTKGADAGANNVHVTHREESAKAAIAEIDQLMIRLILVENVLSFDDAANHIADRFGVLLGRRVFLEADLHDGDPEHNDCIFRHYLAHGEECLSQFSFIGATGMLAATVDRLNYAVLDEIERLAFGPCSQGGHA